MPNSKTNSLSSKTENISIETEQGNESIKSSDSVINKLLWPVQAVFVMGSEFCERFCFYGMKAILPVFLTTRPIFLKEHTATMIIHTFNFSAFFATIIGAILADNYIGRYWTIISLSLVYCAGSCILALSALIASLAGHGTASYVLTLLIFIVGLVLIAVGTGGIKPCVSNFGGDQYPKKAFRSRAFFFAAFYFIINAGSLASTFITPLLSHHVACFGSNTCYPLAFGVPAILMLIALGLFMLGTPLYSALSMSRPGKPVGGTKYDELFQEYHTHDYDQSFKEKERSSSSIRTLDSQISLKLTTDALLPDELKSVHYKSPLVSPTYKVEIGSSRDNTDLEKEENEVTKKNDIVLRFIAYSSRKICRRDTSMYKDDVKFCEDSDRMLRLGILFLPLMFFWALFDQQGSRWIFQAMLMDPRIRIPFTSSRYIKVLPEQTALINSILILLFIPIFNYGIYPLIEKIGNFRLSPTTKMCTGMFLSAAAFGAATILQFFITSYGTFELDEHGAEHCINGCVSVAWQLPQYILITGAEVFVSITGLAFAYEVSPDTMRTVCQAVWQLSIAMGNLVVVFVTLINPVIWFFPKTSSESARLPWNFALWTVIIVLASIVFIPISRRHY